VQRVKKFGRWSQLTTAAFLTFRLLGIRRLRTRT
jgi:hypothetical protein